MRSFKTSFLETAGNSGLLCFFRYPAKSSSAFSGMFTFSALLVDGPWPDSVLTSTLHEGSIKGFSGEIVNADWEALNYHNDIPVLGNIEIIIWFFLCLFFLMLGMTSFIHFGGWGSSHWQAFPQSLSCRLCPWAICGRHGYLRNRGLL